MSAETLEQWVRISIFVGVICESLEGLEIKFRQVSVRKKNSN
jgi:hypothetical protein